jgi:polyisoprenoid-binding protein YceI
MKKIIVILSLITGWFFGGVLIAQEYVIDKSLSSINMSGTSTLHDWHMRAATFKTSFDVKTNGNDITVSDVNVRVKTGDITSSKNIMNNKAADALEAEDHPWIVFDMLDVKGMDVEKSNLSGTISGNLTIAGVTRQVDLPFSGLRTSDNRVLSVEGTINLNMTDYDIEPPVALLGRVETDEMVKLDYKVTLKKANK